MDLGVSAMLLSSGLSIIVSQRLARRLCESCKTKAKLNAKQIHFFRKNRIDPTGIFRAVGCEECYSSGYRGRIAICDVLPLSKKLKDSLVNNQMLIDEMRKDGTKKGMSNLYKQGLKKVVTGTISISELKRVIG
jgi:type IV pilus assembly protein PilB